MRTKENKEMTTRKNEVYEALKLASAMIFVSPEEIAGDWKQIRADLDELYCDLDDKYPDADYEDGL